MHITYDLNEFVERTKWISDFEYLARLGFTTCSVAGTFLPSDADDLLDFCAKNPSYHIISAVGGGVFVNRYDARGGAFRLAEGDKDPNYALSGKHIIQDTLEKLRDMMIPKKPDGKKLSSR